MKSLWILVKLGHHYRPTLMAKLEHWFDKILLSPFLTDAITRGFEVQKQLKDRTPTKCAPDYELMPDEHQFYLLRVSSTLVNLANNCEHLQNIPALLTGHRATPTFKALGITSQRQLVYHVENYLIRAKGIEDRVLKIVDAVFHLMNSDRSCTSSVVLQNLKVMHYPDVGAAVKEVQKLARIYAPQRNEVVHAGSLSDEKLRTLELYHLAQRAVTAGARKSEHDFPGLIRELTREIVSERRKEFAEFNQKMAAALDALLTVMHKHYTRERKYLATRP